MKATKKACLELTNVSKRFGDKWAIKNVSLDIKPGEIYGFLGPNGAGKSTTIRLILDILKPTAGNVVLLGAKNTQERVKQHAHIGYLAGDFAAYSTMTGKKFLQYISKLNGWRFNDETLALADRFGTDLNTPIKKLSKGNRQKIGLVSALMNHPKLVILDEPTSGLDPLIKEIFYDEVRRIAQDGAAVFFSSHDLGEVQKICTKAAFIRQGEIIDVRDIMSSTNLVAHRYHVVFHKQPDISVLKKVKHVESVSRLGDEYEIVVNGDVDDFIQTLARLRPKSLHESELELEDIFMKFYQKNGGVR